ncbi:hypothetical protein ACFSSB_03860 [Lacinutrix gracilariae]|uniref:Long-chain fatty acid transport protein n=1 Tax=Lacinutrix gracilariae TaxID=1747198 RepID=A0ABW5JY90_9FLAO
MNKSKYLIVLAMVCSLFGYAQTNNLTSSPYSLFGLGVESNSNTGRSSGLGKTGISLDASGGVNLYNPASFVTLKENEFVLDFGGSAELIDLSVGNLNEQSTTTTFTNISLGFNYNGKYGMGLTLKPATTVGYSLIGLQSNIEGSDEEFITNIEGSGGLNELRLDYGRKMNNNLNLGIKTSYLFGKITESESINTSDSYLNISEKNYYSGFQIGLGLQYKLLKKHNLGFTLDFPTVLKGSKDVTIGKYSNFAYAVLEQTTGEDIDDFYLPLKLGFGYSAYFKNLLLTADYNKKFWSATNQEDALGDYVDQNIFSLGASYTINPKSQKYFNRVNYRFGLNYNTGYLKVEDKNIDSYAASIGFGLPLGKRSLINISYSLEKKGTTESILIEEYINTLNINISLSDLWFQKPKYD